MKVPLLDLKRQYEPLKAKVFQELERLFDSGAFILGPDVAAFEKEVCAYMGSAQAIGVSNGTDALWIALKALGVGPGDKVLTSPFTFFATMSAILNVGAEPVFAEIEADTFNLSPAAVKEVLEKDQAKKIKAMIPVHLYGQVADMDPLCALAKKHGIAVVEDAAQAIGTHYQGKMAGTIGDFGCFSFFPSKNLGGLGDGGMVTVQNAALAERAKLIRTHGSAKKYHHDIVGGNFRLDTMQATVLRVFLPQLDGWIKKRQAAAARYDQALASLGETFRAPVRSPNGDHTFHQYTIRVTRGSRDSLHGYLNEEGIGNAVYYPIPCHLQKAVKHLGYQPGMFPVSEKAALEVISLPIFPEITQAEQSRVVDCLTAWAKRNG